jgi:hypothetical protein
MSLMMCSPITHTHILLGLCCVKVQLHDDDEFSSRMTLFKAGGDDVAQHYVITMSTSNVTSFLFLNPIHPHMNGILPHAPYYDHARLTSTPMGSMEEATEVRELKSDKAHAWKRKRKRGGWTGPSSGPTGAQTERSDPHAGPTGDPRLISCLPLYLCNLQLPPCMPKYPSLVATYI